MCGAEEKKTGTALYDESGCNMDMTREPGCGSASGSLPLAILLAAA